MNTQLQKNKGFTIIEVVLVLAIAALIFLMIFIALPALQRNQRDTARKNDASAVAAAIQNYRSNTRKGNPTTTAQLATYIDKLDQYENGDVVVTTGRAAGAISAADDTTRDQILVYPGLVCDSADATKLAKGRSRSAAVVVYLENNGTTTLPFCADV